LCEMLLLFDIAVYDIDLHVKRNLFNL